MAKYSPQRPCRLDHNAFTSRCQITKLIDFLPEVHVIRMHLVSLVAILYQLDFGTSFNEPALTSFLEDRVPFMPSYGLPSVPIPRWNQNGG